MTVTVRTDAPTVRTSLLRRATAALQVASATSSGLISERPLAIHLDGTVGSGSGANVGGGGASAWTTIDPAITLTNVGQGTLYVEIDHSGVSGSGNDIQFVARDSAGDVLQDADDPAFVDRGGTSTAVETTVGGSGGDTIGAGGALELESTESVDIVVQVVSADGASTTDGVISSVTIEAYEDKSDLTLSLLTPP